MSDDPVILPEHEQKVAAAAATGDNALVAVAQEDYDQAREDYAKHLERRDAHARKLAGEDEPNDEDQDGDE